MRFKDETIVIRRNKSFQDDDFVRDKFELRCLMVVTVSGGSQQPLRRREA